ncbi:AmmeMemoRadiSam system protein A [Clostridium sp.]|uniref:AmmeMemoRadiSam system protein A n=1 Tax=Clostridium sp. TaxID=1506 RepID=UPI003F30E985
MLDYFLMPHPPIMIPEVGKGREEDIRMTIDSCKYIGDKIDKLDVETIILVTPHGPVFRDGISMFTSKSISGDLSKFGAPQVKLGYEIDITLTSEIIKNSNEKGIVVADLNEDSVKNYGIPLELDHGSIIPLYYLNNSKGYKLVSITYGLLSPLELVKFGECINKSVNNLGKKAVFIASGDLSHRLIENGPYPYTPLGKEFDNSLINTLESGNLKKLFSLDKTLVNEAGQCGLRSIYILSGAIGSTTVKSKLLSYEGPLGVGYGVMEFKEDQGCLLEEMLSEKELEHIRRINEGNPYTRLARKNLDSYYNKGILLNLEDVKDKELVEEKKGVFVSLKINGELRGCIGTISPTTNSIAEEIIKNSISAALNDPRFSQVKKEELLEIDISVDLLYPAEKTTFEDLDPKTYGVIVTSGGKRGLLLPNLEGVNTREQQVSIALEKGGISPNERYTLERFKVERYREVEDDD